MMILIINIMMTMIMIIAPTPNSCRRAILLGVCARSSSDVTWFQYSTLSQAVVCCALPRGPKGRLAKGRLAKGRKQCGLKHSETYRTPIFCTVPLPKVPLVPSKL